MKQFYFFITMLALAFNINSLKAQTVEFSYNLSAVLPDGGVGNVGVIFINNEFWVSEWASSDIHVLDNTGSYIETFQITGVSGTISMTTDGTSVYIGKATNSNIYQVNPTTRTLVSTIPLTITPEIGVRVCAFDPTLNGNAGGFWIADFDTDIISVSMTGNELSAIPAATHGLVSMIGGAIDGIGNLYVYNQDGVNLDRISVIALSSGTQTGVHYDVYANVSSPLGATSSLAGGLFFSDEVIAGERIAIGLSQGTPDNILFGLDFGISLSVGDFMVNNNIALFPNPADNYISISGLTDYTAYTVYNILGAQIMSGIVSNKEEINIENLTTGIFYLKFENGNTLKFVKK